MVLAALARSLLLEDQAVLGGPGVEKAAPLLQSEVESALSICIVEDHPVFT